VAGYRFAKLFFGDIQEIPTARLVDTYNISSRTLMFAPRRSPYSSNLVGLVAVNQILLSFFLR
jgi:hypothetical protein